jgi:hypothetical protein
VSQYGEGLAVSEATDSEARKILGAPTRDLRSSRSPFPETQAARRRLNGAQHRLARCPMCGHAGAVPRDAPIAARLQCSGCGTSLLVGQAIGKRRAQFQHRWPDYHAKHSAAADVLARYGSPALNDSLNDLFRNGDGGGS